MTSSTQSGQDDGVLTPDSAPTPNTIFGAALARVAHFCQYARAHTSGDLIFHRATAGGEPVQLFGVDLAAVLQGAAAWGELLPLVDGGLSEGSRAALDAIGAFRQRYDEIRANGVKLGPVVCSLDSTGLNFDDVTHVTYLLDFVDQVAKRNPISAVPGRLSPFNDAMLDVFQVIIGDMQEADLDDTVKRAQRIWPEITRGMVVMTMAALATRSTVDVVHASEGSE
jgi:hypothetical protein